MAEYRPFPVGLGAFAVEVVFPSGRVEVVRGFQTEAEALDWIATRHVEDAKREKS